MYKQFKSNSRISVDINLMNQFLRIEKYSQAITKEEGGFRNINQIRPVNCDRLSHYSNKLEFCSKELCEKFNNPLFLNSSINTNRYHFLNDLYSVQSRTTKIEELLNEFRPICFSKTTQKQRLFKRIKVELSTLIKILIRLNLKMDGMKGYYNIKKY